MRDYSREDVLKIVQLAENGSEPAARERLKKRLNQSRRPSSRDMSGTWVNWGGMSEVLGQPFDVARIPLSKLEQMRRDPMLAFGLMFIKVPLIRAPWYIKSSDARRAAFIDSALRRIYGRFILAYTNCFDYGFSAIVKRFEYMENMDWTYEDRESETEKPVWESKTVKPLIWKPFTALNPRSVIPHWNYSGEFAGIDYHPGGGVGAFGTSAFPGGSGMGDSSKVADIPLDWALWATNEKDSVFGSLWGYPRTGYSVRYWWTYWYEFALSSRAFERWADPPFVVFHPAEDAVDANGQAIDFGDEALGLAEQVRSGSNISMPSSVVRGYDERQTSVREWYAEQIKSEANFQALSERFEYLDVQKLRAVMVPEQALVEGKGGTSSRNVAATFGDIFQESQAVVMEEIDDHLNRFVIPQLLESNFGPGGPTCTKITTGFDPQDLDTMKAIIESIANIDGASKLPIDEVDLLKRLNIPSLTRAEFKKKLDKVAEEAEKMHAREMEAKNRQAGVNADGQYYDPRDRITLNSVTQPYVIERVDELPLEDNPPAVYDPEKRTLYVRRDANADSIKQYIINLAEAKQGEPGIPELPEVRALLEKINELNLSERQDPEIHVHMPENASEKKKKTKEVFLRDDDGNLTGKIVEEIEEEDSE